jgi:hypothetical protein
MIGNDTRIIGLHKRYGISAIIKCVAGGSHRRKPPAITQLGRCDKLRKLERNRV